MLHHSYLSPWPFYEQDEIDAAAATLQSGQVNYWTGKLGREFERQYAESVGKRYGIALSNGTVALELALRALGVGAGDEVIVASRSYVASASCVLMVGARPVFADVDLDDGNLSAETILPCITKKTKAIIPVHVGGLPCQMDEIMALADKHGILVIEDCAQAHGAYLHGRSVGSWGQAAIFSFCQDKIISTGGEGGMLLLDSEQAYKAAWAYKDIGRSYDAVYHKAHPVGFRWLTESAGSNFRMTEFQAAIGIKQLAKLSSWVDCRNRHAQAIAERLSEYSFIDVSSLPQGEGNINAYYRLYAKINSENFDAALNGNGVRDLVVSKMNALEVPCFVGSCSEIYREKLFVDLGCSPKERHRNASVWADNGFCFLTHPTITSEQMNRMCDTIDCALDNLMS
jgi:dTDP-4-amino-4,6-dideoxygalactose transaminase